MTSTSRQPGRQEATTSGSRIACQTRPRGAAMEKRSSIRIVAAVLASFALYNHCLVDQPSLLDHNLIVEDNRAVAHWDIVVATGVALSAALRVGTRGEKEVARECPRRG